MVFMKNISENVAVAKYMNADILKCQLGLAVYCHINMSS